MKTIYFTHRGAVRNDNQDRIQIAGTVLDTDMDWIQSSKELNCPILLSVIDGMGGTLGGATAAQILASELAHLSNSIAEIPQGKDVDYLFKTFKKAEYDMQNKAQTNPKLNQMGATVAGILLRENRAIVFNCGDCRVYRLTGGNSLEKLTHDHSIVQTLVDTGRLKPEEMRTHPQKNIITSSISAGDDYPFSLYTREISIHPTDKFFICSDGVWEALSSDDLKHTLISKEQLYTLHRKLLLEQCTDNISFILTL